MHREEIPLFCVEKFLSHSTETFRRETLLCFRKLLVSKNFMDKRGEGRDCHVFVRKIFCLTVPQNFLEELFCASEVFGYPKILWIRRGVSRFFTEIFFVSQCWKFLWGNPNVFQKFSGIKKLFVSEGGGGYHLSSSKVFRITVLINFVRATYNTSKKPGYRKSLGIWRGRGYYHSLWKNFCITEPKNFVEGPFCASKLLVSKKFRDRSGRAGNIRTFCRKEFVILYGNFS